MREQLVALFKLQEIDSQALEYERGANALPDKIMVLENELEKMRADLGLLHTEADGRRREQRELESQINEETGKHRTWKRRLNEIKTPREYQALSREIELGERQVRDFEESVLGMMAELEVKQKVIDGKDVDLKAREIEVAAKVRVLRDKQAQLQDEGARIRKGREEIVAKLPKPLVSQYERVRAARNGIAVVLAVDGGCTGCNVKLRPQHIVVMRKLTSVEQCPGCQRILVPEDLVKTQEPVDGEAGAI